jgi:hypothetical protein
MTELVLERNSVTGRTLISFSGAKEPLHSAPPGADIKPIRPGALPWLPARHVAIISAPGKPVYFVNDDGTLEDVSPSLPSS